jgi:hypothetical protein
MKQVLLYGPRCNMRMSSSVGQQTIIATTFSFNIPSNVLPFNASLFKTITSIYKSKVYENGVRTFIRHL